MARSQLIVSSELTEAFVSAQNGSVRWLQVKIENESFVCALSYPASSDASEDFSNLQTSYLSSPPSLFLFCSELHVAAQRWQVISYVPDTSAVRDKMLYSSSRDALKRQLGYNYFITGDFAATDAEEMNYAAFTKSKREMQTNAPLTESEILAKEEAKLERDVSVKSNAMGVVPFEFTSEARTALESFKDLSAPSFVILKLEGESVELLESSNNSVESSVSMDSPCFILYRHSNNSKTFVFSCPEETSIRAKMIGSTCKGTVLAEANKIGIEFDRTTEVRDVADIQSTLNAATTSTTTNDDATTNAAKFSKPTAPGRRGRTKKQLK